MTRWAWTVAALLGEPLPPLPDLPGRRIACQDAPPTPEDIDAIEHPAELALVLGITRQAAHQRLTRRQAAASTDKGLT